MKCKNAGVTIEDGTLDKAEKGNTFMFLKGEFSAKVSNSYVYKLSGDKIFQRLLLYI